MATTYAIPDGRVAMAATTFTGTGAAQTVSNAVNGVSFRPDLVWVKGRSFASYNGLIDSVRGRAYDLYSNATSAEETSGSTEDLTAFTSSGFSLGTPARFGSNNSGQTYVGWQWKAGGTAVSNTAGSITSSVSANPTAGFSVVTYTGTGSNATVGHGLGVAPQMIIVKNRNSAGFNWVSWHIGLTSGAYYINLNTTAAQGSDATVWNSTVPTSSVFSIGTSPPMNTNGNTQVAYCFAPVAGYSAFGKYTGNGSADGPFVYLGFRPRFVLIKRTDVANDWVIYDTSRSTYNAALQLLYPNLSNAEVSSGTDIDIISNGFKIRNTNNYCNASGGTFIYMAFAENPFKYANAR